MGHAALGRHWDCRDRLCVTCLSAGFGYHPRVPVMSTVLGRRLIPDKVRMLRAGRIRSPFVGDIFDYRPWAPMRPRARAVGAFPGYRLWVPSLGVGSGRLPWALVGRPLGPLTTCAPSAGVVLGRAGPCTLNVVYVCVPPPGPRSGLRLCTTLKLEIVRGF